LVGFLIQVQTHAKTFYDRNPEPCCVEVDSNYLSTLYLIHP